MPDLPADFDLKLMPDWLKEPAGKNPYADYEGRDDRRGDWGGGDRGDRRGRPGGGPGRPGGGRGDNRGPRRDGPGSGPRRDDRAGRPGGAPRRPDGKAPQGAQGRQDDRRGKPGEPRRHDGPREDRPQTPQVEPADLMIEFFPDDGCAVSIARQIKSTHRAYSLFDLARMFLARPERHRLKITTRNVASPLFQAGKDGLVTLDKAAAERAAFPTLRSHYYVEVSEQREAPKGNFSKIARCRANGVLLGPTNHHGYQPALRKLYEERFSRRMSFADFQREIEVVDDPALIEQWKEQSSKLTVYHLKPEEPEKKEAPAAEAPAAEATPAAEAPAEQPAAGEADTPAIEGEAAPEVDEAAPNAAADAEAAPAEDAPDAPAEPGVAAGEAPKPYDGPVFESLADVEQHFRENYLPGLIRSASTFHISGDASRSLPDRSIAAAVRIAWEQERGFPGQMMHQLRQQFSRQGLHVFKHRKRMQFVSLIRPSPMEHGSLSPSVAQIIGLIQSGTAHCNRASLAATILGADEAAIDATRRSTLATDLRWLIETGRVIEFSDGRLELPVVPAKNEPSKPSAASAPAEASSPAEAEREPAPGSPASRVAQPETAPIAESPSARQAENAPEPAHAETVAGAAPIEDAQPNQVPAGQVSPPDAQAGEIPSPAEPPESSSEDPVSGSAPAISPA